MNQALLRVIYLLHTLYCIVERIPEQSTDIHRLQKIQFFAVSHTGQAYSMILALYRLGSQDCVKYAVSRFVLGFIAFDFLLHLVKIRCLFLLGCRGAQNRNLMLKVVILLVYKCHTLLRQLVVLILHAQRIRQEFIFKLHLHFLKLHMICKEDADTSKVNQSPYNKYFSRKLSAKRRILKYIAHVAHKIHKKPDKNAYS